LAASGGAADEGCPVPGAAGDGTTQSSGVPVSVLAARRDPIIRTLVRRLPGREPIVDLIIRGRGVRGRLGMDDDVRQRADPRPLRRIGGIERVLGIEWHRVTG